MQLRRLIAVVAVGACLALVGCSTSDVPRLIEDDSFLSGFRVEGQDVYIDCHVVIENRNAADCTFTLEALCSEDVAAGLLQEDKLKGYDESLAGDTFTVGGESIAAFDVVFVGTFAGTNQKRDRLLPEVVLTPVED